MNVRVYTSYPVPIPVCYSRTDLLGIACTTSCASPNVTLCVKRSVNLCAAHRKYLTAAQEVALCATLCDF